MDQLGRGHIYATPASRANPEQLFFSRTDDLLVIPLTEYSVGCIFRVMRTDPIFTDEFGEWFLGLDDIDTEAVARVIDLLATRGVSLGRPYSGTIKNSRHALRELIIQSKGDPIRVFYAFDPKRDAVLLLGGHKAGQDRFYEVYIPKAEKLFDEHLDRESHD